ncbi:sugar kinase [Microbacterium sp. 13-71-7]|uniref:sugar kinase n=1 Tax=Microbacterium sp. 13-71-7 TaxID=1970399 RepID=UPI0025D6D64F|nr:sugar kinase [Microbacterium sp. 13-71-7]
MNGSSEARGRRAVVTFGETMGLAANETPGSIVTARAHTLSFGGADSNVAIALSRLGIPAIWISRLGIDPFGDLIERELRAEGVEVRATRDREHPTGFMLKQRRTTYTATVSYWRRNSAASFLSASDLPDDVLRDAAMLHVTGITPGLSESAQAATFDAIARARAAGVTVSFDVNHRDGVWSRETASPVYRRIAEAADIVFAGVEEAALLVAAPDGGLESAVSALGPDQVVIKRGADGATALIDGALLQQEAVPVEVVDTVGAGDAFVAGYLAAFLEGADPRGRLLQAVTTGALACTSRGDWEGSPNRADLLSQGATEGVAR